MIRILLSAFLILLATITQAAVNAEVDRIQVGEGESLTLTLTADSSDQQPDLSILDANFDVVSRGQGSSYSDINGNTSTEYTWSVQLIPKHIGTIIIPAITMGNEKTSPITIDVGKQASSSQNVPSSQQNSDAFFEVSIDKNQTYVQEQIVLTERFYYRPELPIDGVEANDLSVTGASVEPLNTKGPRYQQTINGITYQVIEATYAIFPEKSGELRIPTQTLKIRMQSSMFAPPQIKRLSSEEKMINVLPQPNKTNPWLPAKELTIQQNWSTNPPVFKVGESVTRKITMIADGLSQSHLPDLPEPKIDGLKMYADKPAVKNTVTTKGLIGTRTDSIAIVATKPGTYTLPEIDIKWWDTDDNIEKTAIVPSFTFTVADNGTHSADTLPITDTSVVTPVATPALPIKTPTTTNTLWFYIAAAFLLLWILTLLLWWQSRQRSRTDNTPTLKEDVRPTTSALDELLTACQQNDAIKTRHALLKWAQQRWPRAIITLESIATKAPSLAEEIAHLEQALYSQNSADWQGSTLRNLIKQLPSEATSQNKKKVSLSPLYPLE